MKDASCCSHCTKPATKGLPTCSPFQTLLVSIPPLRGCGEGEEGFKREPENEREKGNVSAGCSEMEGFVF